ncbi:MULTISPECIES: hypothetical protein [Amycolatopsis]|nr:hypothetical protein [Amycolatopsis thermoflava]
MKETVKNAIESAKEYARETKRAWRETAPQSSKDIRKLEGTDRRGKR